MDRPQGREGDIYYVTQIADNKGPLGPALSADYSFKSKALVTVLENKARSG